MIEKIEFDYEPGYYSGSTNLKNIKIVFTPTEVLYDAEFFDEEMNDIPYEEKHWIKKISKDDFNLLASKIDECLNIPNSYEHYVAECTYIRVEYDDCKHNTIEVYGNFSNYKCLSCVVRIVEGIIGGKYLLPSMKYYDNNYVNALNLKLRSKGC